ncbi:ankyrin repeat-containing domain protein [Daldinia decipiens]|uniref:ankyrin repeat-containing domain protein n=1 Tax=Daldinia decipiens TaxID=326647 RepID=UPI0020C55921|nr:ankyrin repeat-containing domain protein [Daldinia decipiens]KAI1657770.1 ankyrin repeat-containing domain protein [Daldinia decipiens]
MVREWDDVWYATPLHLAAYRGHDDIVALLIKRGSRLSLNSIGVYGCKPSLYLFCTPLHLAIYAMNLSTAKLILSHGIQTPMNPIERRLYLSNKTVGYVRWFIRYIFGTEVTKETKWTCDKWLAVKALSVNGPDTQRFLEGCHHICLSRNCGLVSYAIDVQMAWSEIGMNRPLIHLCLQDPSAKIPIWRAGVNLEVPEVHLPKYALPWFEYLLNHGANVEARNFFDTDATALMIAALNSIEPAMDLLIQHGADVNASDEAGFTALHAACTSSKRADIISKLIANGAQVNATNSTGDSPLIFICRTVAKKNHNKFLEVIELLLTHGANPMLRTEIIMDQSALEIAFRNGFLDAVKLIISIFKPNPTPDQIRPLFEDVIGTCDLSRIRLLLMIDKQNFILRSNSALIKLIKSNKRTTQVAMLLLEKGAPCDRKLVFWIVSYQKGNDLLRKVLECGTSPNVVVGHKRRCPLLKALKIKDVLTRRAYVKSLMEHGADINMNLHPTNIEPIYVHIISPAFLPYTETALDLLFCPDSFQQIPESQQFAFVVLTCRLTHVKILQRLLEFTTGSMIQRFVQRFIERFTATPFITRLLDITRYSLAVQKKLTVEYMDLAIDILDVFARYHSFWSSQPSPGSARAIDTLKSLMAVTRKFTPVQKGSSFCLRKRIRIVDSSAESPQVLILPREDSNEYPQGYITIPDLGLTLRPTLDGRWKSSGS